MPVPVVTRILVADDHPIVRSGLKKVLDAQPDLEVVAEAEDGAEAVRKALDERVEAAEASDGRMRWVLGSMGPGTKLPSLGHTTYAHLRETFALQAEGLIDGGADAFLVETSQDLLQTKAAVNGCKQAIVARGIRLPIFVEVT